ncbi:XK-related protein 7-like isoform X2 [Dermacentor silvarum]|uniref:XK-related protein 7-like isoform X2 n=1 Tax=Dermacentor silvarum TaxID=543639 RepID=UPI0021006989|nr:XK-related protein 7-like isoform X2 [Dermacentor silvarum]
MNAEIVPGVTCREKFFSIFCLVLSGAGLLTDAYTLYTYAVNGLWLYFSFMLSLAVLPNIIVQAFSVSWHIADDCRPWRLVWLTNLLLFGTIHRQWLTMRACFNADKTQQPQDYNAYTQHKSDLCLLDLYKSFLKSAPQLVLQTYILYDTKDWRVRTVGTTIYSLILLVSCMAAYDIDQRRRRPDREPISWWGVIFHVVWRLGIVTSRIGAMVLMAVVDDLWAFGYFGSHFVMTTIFAVVLTEHLVQMEVAPNSPFWQKLMHGIAMGSALTFCFFNVADSSSLHWIILMYMYAGMQNAEALVEFSREWIISGKPYHGTIAISIVAGGFITGVIAMVLHKRLFNPVCTVYLFPSRVSQMKRAEPQQVGDLLRSVEIASHTDHSLSERTPLADRSC